VCALVSLLCHNISYHHILKSDHSGHCACAIGGLCVINGNGLQKVGENGSSGGESDTSVGEKLLSALFTEMDGVKLPRECLF
jgi:hypothetical protein